MNQEIKQKWVTALRSGEYEQGKFQLKNGGKFCCLGVITDLYLKEHNLNWSCTLTQPSGEKNEVIIFDLLPVEVRDWAGLRFNDPRVPFADCTKRLSELNDNYDKSFGELAEIIDSHL